MTMTLERPAVENIHDARPCPLCRADMPVEDVRCALSRYMNLSICSRCGQVEAFKLASLNSNPAKRDCLYFDDVAGIAHVVETENGYRELWPLADRKVAREYVDAVNTRVGLDADEARAIVYRSMFGGGA